MHISWSFLDKRKAAIGAMEAYDSMDFIIRHSDEEIQKVRSRMVGVGSKNMDGMPHAHNPQASEDRVINSIDEIDIIRERYRQAVEYMKWFKPAWKQMSVDEQYLLQLFYMDECDNPAIRAADHFGIERSSAYNRKNRALDHLTLLLYGKA